MGHSAGAPILARMCLDGMIAPKGLVSLNGAFLPLGGSAGQIFAPLARLLVGLPGLPQLFAWRAGDPRIVEKLLASTGSRLDPQGVSLYTLLVRTPGHAAGALKMMANWDLVPVVRDLPKFSARLLLVVGANDRTIPPADSARVQAMVPGATLISMPGLGHLSHEEDPAGTTALVRQFAAELGLV
jgi:magnesium chelatase accessory protein